MTYKTKAIVLKSYAWPRQAKCFVLYTPNHGKVKAVAAGVSKITSKVAGHLQPFMVSDVMVARGRKIDRLAQARVSKKYDSISGNWELFRGGAYVLEIIDRFTHENVKDEFIWSELELVFEELDERGRWHGMINETGGHQDLQLLTRIFALRVLDRLGLRPEFSVCVSCRVRVNPGSSMFSLVQGGLICDTCKNGNGDLSEIGEGLIKFFRFALRRPLRESIRVILSLPESRQFIFMVDDLVNMQLQHPLKICQFV